jgi:oligopeptide transport system substrate-binding protein
MVRFFVIAGLIVLVLVLAPVLLLSRAGHKRDPFVGKVVLHSALPEKVKTFDPVMCGDTVGATMQANVYEGLYSYHYLKRPVEVVPQLAAAMPEISPDGKTYTIRIQPDVRYGPNPCFGVDAEGKALSRTLKASDFVYNLMRCADSHLPSPQAWSFLSGQIVGLDDYHERTRKYKPGDFSRYDLPVEGIKALDDLTLQFKLVQPFPALVYVLAISTYCPMPPEVVHYYLERTPAYEETRPGHFEGIADGGQEIPLVSRKAEITRREAVVGTGPYTLTTWERASLIVLERNPLFRKQYYPTQGAPGDAEAGLLADAGKQVPFIDVLYYPIITEQFSSWMQFLSGQQDLSGVPRDVFNQVITPNKELGERWKKRGISLVTSSDPAVFWLGFNMDDPVIKASKSLRQAMCLAFDTESYIEVLFNGRARRAVNVLPSSFPVYEQAGPSPYARYDVAAAKAKLEDAKKELAAAGLLGLGGGLPLITIDYGSMDEEVRRQGEFTQQQFDAIGLPSRVQLNDWPTLQQKVHNKQTQMYGMGWHADYPDPENFLQLFYGPNIEKGTNSVNYRNPAFDELYRKIVVMSDSPERREMCAKMVRMLNEDVPVLLLIEPLAFVLKYDYVHNNKRHPIGYGMTRYIRIDSQQRARLRGE